MSSYFEWIKNINHTQHGAMTRKWEEKSNYQVLEHIKDATGLKVTQLLDEHFTEIRGASEVNTSTGYHTHTHTHTC